MPSSEPSKPLGSHEGAKSCWQVLLAFVQVNTSRNPVSAAAAVVLFCVVVAGNPGCTHPLSKQRFVIP
ncbi:unnamed protein product [Ectocarpus sp. CCAP 1310/34]|nr:unnamed protein product [Ectocarpus sp. CCAP 1310/34]